MSAPDSSAARYTATIMIGDQLYDVVLDDSPGAAGLPGHTVTHETAKQKASERLQQFFDEKGIVAGDLATAQVNVGWKKGTSTWSKEAADKKDAARLIEDIRAIFRGTYADIPPGSPSGGSLEARPVVNRGTSTVPTTPPLSVVHTVGSPTTNVNVNANVDLMPLIEEQRRLREELEGLREELRRLREELRSHPERASHLEPQIKALLERQQHLEEELRKYRAMQSRVETSGGSRREPALVPPPPPPSTTTITTSISPPRPLMTTTADPATLIRERNEALLERCRTIVQRGDKTNPLHQKADRYLSSREKTIEPYASAIAFLEGRNETLSKETLQEILAAFTLKSSTLPSEKLWVVKLYKAIAEHPERVPPALRDWAVTGRGAESMDALLRELT